MGFAIMNPSKRTTEQDEMLKILQAASGCNTSNMTRVVDGGALVKAFVCTTLKRLGSMKLN
jgi:hypothetical protein